MRNLHSAFISSLILAGCSSIPSTPVPSPMLSSLAPEPIRVTIDVTPRIGLFSHFDYLPGDGNCRTDGDDFDKSCAMRYRRSVDPRLADFFPAGPFELLTTGMESGQSGYKDRAVRIAVTVAGKLPANCAISVGHIKLDKCEWRGRVSNLQVPVTGRVVLKKADGSDESVSIDTFIPEDFLLVSLGDSYGSGEGNPDAQKRLGNYFFDEKPAGAMWMDERCHRSAWAGPLQAGLRLIKDNPTRSRIPTDNGPVAVSVRGAFTVASVACSGATINDGIIGAYEGTVPLTELAKSNPRVRKETRQFYSRRALIRPQVEQVKNLLLESKRGSSGMPKDIDAVVMSIGGNDIGFAPILTSLVLEDYRNLDLKKELELAVESDVSSLLSGTSSYRAVADAFRDGETTKALGGSSVRKLLITAYPDPTYRCSGEDPNCVCTGTVSGGVLGWLLSIFQKGITREEATFARASLVNRLNSSIQKEASNHGWSYVAMDKGGFEERGWCKLRHYGDPYSPNRSWFRDIQESLDYQGDFRGAMHPNWEGHQNYAKRIYDELLKSIAPNVADSPTPVAAAAQSAMPNVSEAPQQSASQ